MHAQRRTRRLAVTVLLIIMMVFLTIGLAGFLLFSRYADTVEADAGTAEREFTAARARFTDRALLEYRGFEAPVVHRNPEAPIRELRTLHVLAYDVDDGKLTRGTFPVSLLRSVTLGGRIRLMGSGFMGGPDERITLGDLERHGPGLVLDSGGGIPGVLPVADAVLGTKSTQSRLLIWTE
jgi:hypothetical protein